MSVVGDRLLTEKTRVLVTISNFVLLIFGIVSGVVFVVNWKADVEHRLSNVEKQVEKYEDMDTTLVEIQTDLKWIRAYMEKD